MLQSSDEELGIPFHKNTAMLVFSSPHLVYSLDGLPLSLLDLTPISTEQLCDLDIRTLEQLARIALISSASDRKTIVNLIEQDLRARLWPDFIHCYALIATEDGEQPQFVIESEQFHFVALVTSQEKSTFTCNYTWLQTGIGESIPFHKPRRASDSRLPASIGESATHPYQPAPVTYPAIITEPPPEAVVPDTAAQVLASETIALSTPAEALPAAHPDVLPVVASLPLKHLNLSNRTYSTLIRRGIRSIGQLAMLNDEDLLKIKGFGIATLAEVHQVLLKIPNRGLEIVALQEKGQLVAEFPMLRDTLSEVGNLPLRFLNLTKRISNALLCANVFTLSDLLFMTKTNLLCVRNIGVKGVEEIRITLQTVDLIEVKRIMADMRVQGQMPANVPLSYLGFPHEITHRRLRMLGIEHLEHLCHYTITDLQQYGLESTDIDFLVAMLRGYGLALRNADLNFDSVSEPSSVMYLDRVADASELQAQPVPPEVSKTSENIVESKPITVVDAIRAMLALVEPRQAEVLRQRYGLEGRGVCTLAEVGQQLDLTRERVRQLEEKGINKLQHPHRRRVLNGLILSLEQALRESNGVMSLNAARKIVSTHADAEADVSESLLAFILLFAPHITSVKKMPILALNRQPYDAYISAIDEICTALKRVISQAFAPLPLDEVLKRFASDPDGLTIGLQVPEQFVIACLKAHPDIMLDDEGLYGLKQWSTKRLDDIIVAMRQLGKPMHYSEIAERVNQRLPAGQQTTAHNVHAQIGRLPNLFVRVGHGIFGLAEWGLEQDGSLADAAYRVLCEANHALHIEQLTDRVLETWHVKRSSVRAAIDLDNRFMQVSRNLYWLTGASPSNPEGGPINDFETLFGEVLLRRHEELERDRVASSEHDALEEFRRLGTAIFS